MADPTRAARPCNEDRRDALRRDAVDNRQRILQAARAAFAEQGLSASVAEVARRSGLGNATIYRHFDGKDALIDAVYEDWVVQRQKAGARMLDDPDPWHGLSQFLEDGLSEGSRDRAVGDLLATRGLTPMLHYLRDGLRRCQAAGLVGADITAPDLMLALVAIGRTIDITGDVAPEQWRRQLAVLLRGLRAGGAPALPGVAMEEVPLTDAIRTARLRRERQE